MFLGKGFLKKCCNFTGEHPCRSVVSIKLLCDIIEFALRHRCSPVDLLHIFRTPFPNTSRWLLLIVPPFLLGLTPKFHQNCKQLESHGSVHGPRFSRIWVLKFKLHTMIRWYDDKLHTIILPFRGVLSKMCSETMQQIYRRTPMPKCDFNKVLLLRPPLDGCFWYYSVKPVK